AADTGRLDRPAEAAWLSRRISAPLRVCRTFDGVPSRFPEPFHHPPRTKKLPPKWRPRDFLSEARRNLVRNCLCHLEPNPTTRKQRGNRPRIQPVRERHKIILSLLLNTPRRVGVVR